VALNLKYQKLKTKSEAEIKQLNLDNSNLVTEKYTEIRRLQSLLKNQTNVSQLQEEEI
jgi:hypothetical protein